MVQSRRQVEASSPTVPAPQARGFHRLYSSLERVVIILGVILIILGVVLSIPILYTIGIILAVIGLILTVLGAIGRGVGGRKTYF